MATISGFRITINHSSRTDSDAPLGNCLVVRFLVSLSLVLLLFSSLGPGFDHHFHERAAHHSHAFVGFDAQSTHAHQHQFGSDHVHDGLLISGTVDGGRSGPLSISKGVVYLTLVDVFVQSHPPMALTTDHDLGIFPDLPSGLHEFALMVENKIPENRNTKPLDNPLNFSSSYFPAPVGQA